MHYKKRLACAACGAALVLAGCAGNAPRTQNEPILPEIDIVQVKENSEEAFKIAQQTKLDIEGINKKLAEIDTRHILPAEDVSGGSEAKIKEIENRLAQLAEAFKDLQAQVNMLGNSPAARAAKPVQTGPAALSPSSAASASQGGSEYDSYQTALRVFNSRYYKQAEGLFSDIIKQYPAGTYTDNCYYWSGECGYAQGDYAKAVSLFRRVLEFRNSSKADDAQLKLGMCYMKMGQNALARTEFTKLIELYPGSEYVPRAQKYLSELK